MARGGINKALVQEARQALMSKGVNPSIDAVRVQLGNTGSRTTISRYLKEIEVEEGTQLSDDALLSDTLKQMITSMAAQLRQEAMETVEKNEQRYREQIAGLNKYIDELKNSLSSSEKQCQAIEQQLEQQAQDLKEALKEQQKFAVQATEYHEKLEQLAIRMDEKDTHIKSLEDKHRHARDNLDHYRQSVKEQREQDQRAHEQQIQGIQQEQRQLKQTLIVKQDEITRLNSDNSRLITEINSLQKENRSINSKFNKIESKLGITHESEIKLKTKLDQLAEEGELKSKNIAQLDQQIQQLTNKNNQLEKSLLETNTELKTKNEIFNSIQSKLRA